MSDKAAKKGRGVHKLRGASRVRVRAHMDARITRTQPLITLPKMCPHLL